MNIRVLTLGARLHDDSNVLLHYRPLLLVHVSHLSGEIAPGWIEAFACNVKFLKTTGHFDMNDLDADGINVNVLGALPLLEAPRLRALHRFTPFSSSVKPWCSGPPASI